jgi:proline iminopeptidase
MVCPVQSAFDLHRAWPQAKLEIIPEAGHSAAELGITHALVRATQEMAARFGRK